jgi:hypothetical protein
MNPSTMFTEVQKIAKEAMEGAAEDTATELTSRLQGHLQKKGIPAKGVKKSRMVYNKKTDDFEPSVPKSVRRISEGTSDTNPTGIVVQFTNSIEAEIPRIYDKALLERSRGGGLA